jgi:hypothetical protein
MTAPRPYSEKPRWDEIGAILIIGGTIAALAGLVAGWWLAMASGAVTALSGLTVRTLAQLVW